MSGPPSQSGASLRARAVLKLTDAAGVAGSRGRTVVSWADLLLSTGPGYGWRRLRAERTASLLSEPARDAVYADIWREAAAELGAELVELSAGFYEARKDPARTRIWRQVVALDDPVTLRLALDKPLVHRMLASAGVPTPDHRQLDFRDVAPALDFMGRAAGPCVVKPASGTGGGEGTTAGVETVTHLARARVRAARRHPRLLIERQVEGPVWRLLFLDGELLDVVRSLPPRLTGDGRSTVEQLIASENRRRIVAGGRAGLSLIEVDLDCLIALERAGLKLSSVVAEGQVVAVHTVSNDGRIEDSETFRDGLAPEVVEAARAAAGAIGLRLAGVDVIAPDLARPLAESGGAVTEVNGSPGIHRHYHVAEPERATRVAVPILQKLLG